MDSATSHTFFTPIVGRYANRNKNGTFSLEDETYNIPANENRGANALHGGRVGYDQWDWTLTSQPDTNITFTILDNALEGFPGFIVSHASYTLSSADPGPLGQKRPGLTFDTVSFAWDQETPITPGYHFYWILGAFTTPKTLDDQSLWMPYSKLDTYGVQDQCIRGGVHMEGQ